MFSKDLCSSRLDEGHRKSDSGRKGKKMDQRIRCWLPRRCQVGLLLLNVLLIPIFVGCAGSPPVAKSTPAVHATSTAPIMTPKVTPSPGLAQTPISEVTFTPTQSPSPGETPTPTPFLCATPPGVQPVSSIEVDRGDTRQPLIALTFDAGGPSGPTSHILDILATHHLRVTFFVTGDWAKENPDLVRRIHQEGHEIGNHTMNHLDLVTLPDAQVCSELTQAEQVISPITGVTTRPYYRPPYGSRDNRVRQLAAQLGYRTIYWTVDTLDWQSSATSESITTIAMNHLGNGVIVLMHAGSQVESETLDKLIIKIEQAGYQIVRLSQIVS